MAPLLGTATAEGHAPDPDLDLVHVPGHVHALAPPKGDQGKILYFIHTAKTLYN